MRLRASAALRDERGFTLVEILVVLIVLAILSSIAVSSYRGYQARAHDAAAQEDIDRIVPSIHGFFVDHDSYTGMTLEGLKTSYDSAIDPARFTLGNLTDSTYCLHTSSGGRTWRKNGPTGAVEPQPCP